MFHSSPREALVKYFKHIKPSKEERIQSILPKPDGPSVRLMPSSTIEAANSDKDTCYGVTPASHLFLLAIAS